MRASLVLAIALTALSPEAACVIGPDSSPGCRSDAECDPSFACRAGACFRQTTTLSPPRDLADAGDAGDGS